MDLFNACGIIEGFVEVDEDEVEDKMQEAWQYLINTGDAWRLQGFYGRTAQQLIEAGICEAAK